MSDLLHAVLHDAADRYPGAVAVVDGDRELTYAQLDRAASKIAHQLAALGVRRGDRVGLCVEKSAESLICLYGVLKAGAAYVPLAGEWPAGRLAHIVAHAGIRVLLTGTERARLWPVLAGPDSPVQHLVCVNGSADAAAAELSAEVLGPEAIERQPADRPPVAGDADDLAYVLYTSGSTGVPKGVMLSHRNALAFVDWAAEEFALTPQDRLSNHAPLHFDLAVFDIFGAARAAAAVVLVPRRVAAFPAEMAAFVRDKAISVWYSVPSALNMLASAGGLPAGSVPGLRLVLFAGEVMPVDQLRAAMRTFPDAGFCNLYGPTETNVCTFYWVPRPLPPDATSIPIGGPITGVELLCRTDSDKPAQPGELGELWVHGPTVMRGYLGDPGQSAKVLRAPDPARPDLVAYCTGDLVALDEASGFWNFTGRRDSQIKSRGYRIELGEIVAALNRHPSIAECAAIPVPDARFGNLIKAYVVASGQLRAADLLVYSRNTLPAYMVPSSFEVLDALPRTSTDKIDYQALKKLPHKEG